jgi:hypothetical protein
VHLAEIATVLGKPLALRINQDHLMPVNQLYPLLPGKATLRIEDSSYEYQINVETGKATVALLNAVKVEVGCPPWDWSCLGAREIQLFENGEYYPFVETLTDIPVVYFKRNISVGITGSRELKYQIPEEVRYTSLQVGIVEIEPELRFSPGRVTDLVRIEPSSPQLDGVSMDIPSDRPTRLYLFAGNYKLAHYVSASNYEGDRVASYRLITVESGKAEKLTARFLVADKALARNPEDEPAKKPKTATIPVERVQPRVRFF